MSLIHIPLGAAVFSRRIAEAIYAHDGEVLTGHTFAGHTAACAGGVAVQRIIEAYDEGREKRGEEKARGQRDS